MAACPAASSRSSASRQAASALALALDRDAHASTLNAVLPAYDVPGWFSATTVHNPLLTSEEQCQTLCKAHPSCNYFSYEYELLEPTSAGLYAHECFLKAAYVNCTAADGGGIYATNYGITGACTVTLTNATVISGCSATVRVHLSRTRPDCVGCCPQI